MRHRYTILYGSYFDFLYIFAGIFFCLHKSCLLYASTLSHALNKNFYFDNYALLFQAISAINTQRGFLTAQSEKFFRESVSLHSDQIGNSFFLMNQLLNQCVPSFGWVKKTSQCL